MTLVETTLPGRRWWPWLRWLGIALALALAVLAVSWLVAGVRESQRQAHLHAVLDQKLEKYDQQRRNWIKANPGKHYNDTLLTRVGVMPAQVLDIWGGEVVLLGDGRVLYARDLLSLHLGPEALPLTLDPDEHNRRADPHTDRYAVPSRHVGFEAYVWSDESGTRFGLYHPPGLPQAVVLPAGQAQHGDVVAVATGAADFAVVLTQSGRVHAFGKNNLFGQLGPRGADKDSSDGFVMDDAIAIAAGVRHGLALRRDGTVWMWGQDDLPKANLGPDLPSTAYRPQLRRIDHIPRITKIAAAGQASFALAEDGAVWAWGETDCAMMGMDVSQAPLDRIDSDIVPYFAHYKRSISDPDPSQIDRPSRLKPVQIPGLRDVVDVKAAPHHVVALRKDGTVWGWGDNQFQQIGSPEFEPPRYPGLCRVVGERQIPQIEQPRQMMGVDHVRQIFVADGMTALVKDDQSFWLVGRGCRLCGNFKSMVATFKTKTWAEVAARGMWCQKVEQVTRLREAVDRFFDNQFPFIRSLNGNGASIDSDNNAGRLRFRNTVSELYLQGYDIQTRDMRRNDPRNPKENNQRAQSEWATIWWKALDYDYSHQMVDFAQGETFTAFIRPEDEQIIRRQCASVDRLFEKAMADVGRENLKAVERWTLH